MKGAWRSLVARVLWEHAFLQVRLIAITDFITFITTYKEGESDKTLVARVPLYRIFLTLYFVYTYKLQMKYFIAQKIFRLF